MKFIKLFFISFVVVSINVSSIYASALSNSTLNQADYNILFGDEKVDVAILSEKEMRETKGEFGPLFWGFVIGLGAWGIESLVNR